VSLAYPHRKVQPEGRAANIADRERDLEILVELDGRA
jgi:hypothetical protein